MPPRPPAAQCPGANAGFRVWLAHLAGEWVGLAPHDALPADDTVAAYEPDRVESRVDWPEVMNANAATPRWATLRPGAERRSDAVA